MEKSAKLEENPDMPPDDVRQIKAERDSLQKELTAANKKIHDLEAAHAQLQVSHAEYVSKHGPLPKPYQYAENECRPVAPHAKCPICGWDRDTETKPGMTGRQPHPV